MTENIDNLGKPTGKDKTFSRDEILTIANSGYNIRDRALFVTLYLSNSRICEIIKRLRKKDIILTKIDEKPYLVFTNLYTEKNRNHPDRNIPVSVEYEKELIAVLDQYLSMLKDDDILFNINRHRAWTILKNLCGRNPHFLRHSRLTHLTVDFGLGETAITRMAGWSDSRQALKYIHLKWKDIASMIKK